MEPVDKLNNNSSHVFEFLELGMCVIRQIFKENPLTNRIAIAVISTPWEGLGCVIYNLKIK
jgi:hypothetical protein